MSPLRLVQLKAVRESVMPGVLNSVRDTGRFGEQARIKRDITGIVSEIEVADGKPGNSIRARDDASNNGDQSNFISNRPRGGM